MFFKRYEQNLFMGKLKLIFSSAGLAIILLHSAHSSDRKEALSTERLLSIVSSQYINYCDHEKSVFVDAAPDYQKSYWIDHRSCLTDGRIHLVYANDKEGKHDTYALGRNGDNKVTFTDKDKEILLDAIYEGAQVYVGEYNHRVLCVESSIHSAPANEAVCSATDRIFAGWSTTDKVRDTESSGNNNKRHPLGRADAKYNRYLSSGYREYHHIHLNQTLSAHPKEPAKNASDAEKEQYFG